MMKILLLSTFCFCLIQCGYISSKKAPITYDWVLQDGRVIDPASQTDATLHIGINADTIARISKEKLLGKQVIDAANLVVAPGFIDLHSHTPTPLGQFFQLRDGVTTALDLESGAFPQSGYGEFLKDGAYIHHGASVGYFAIRIKVMENRDEPYIFSSKGAILPHSAFTEQANSTQIEEMRILLHQDLEEGGIGIGLLLDYMTGAIGQEELAMIFEVAGKQQAPIWTHIRRGVQGDPAGLNEIIDLSKKYNAPVHICHIHANAMGQIANWLKKIDTANDNGADVSMEMYPYTAGSTSISADVFNRDWQTIFGINYDDIQWSATDEFLTKETWEKI
jgi:N-acyl-D-aspartate/D-glutamate deacylase